jgi:DNA-directed RNA polymerase specialized sigma24 family protein
MNDLKHNSSQNASRIDPAIAGDSNLVSALRTRSAAAFAEFHAIYSKRLCRTIIAITKSPEDAEDVLQKTFLRT